MGFVELYVGDIFDLELLLGLALFGVEDQQAFEGSVLSLKIRSTF